MALSSPAVFSQPCCGTLVPWKGLCFAHWLSMSVAGAPAPSANSLQDTSPLGRGLILASVPAARLFPVCDERTVWDGDL